MTQTLAPSPAFRAACCRAGPLDRERARIRAFYDLYWSSAFTRRETLWRGWWQEAYDQMLAWVGPVRGKRVLVLFAGQGADARLLAGLGARTVALDFATRGLRHLTREGARCPGAWPVCADAQSLPCPDRTFDIVLVINGICHTDKIAVLAECRRVLRPAGKIALLEVMRWPHLAVLARLLEPFRWRAPHRFVTTAEIARLAAGYRTVRQRQMFVVSVLTIMARRLWPRARWLAALHRAAQRADRILLRRLPWLRHISYLSVVCLEP